MPALANAKHEAVLQAFIADPKRIGWRAYKSVYRKSSQRAAETAWSRLLKGAEFAARLEELKIKVATQIAETVAISAQHVFDELVKIGFANMRDFMRITADGDPAIDLAELTRDQAAALQSITVEDFKDGRGENARDVRKITIKLHDKRAALVDLGKHFGLFTPKEPGAAGKDAPDERPVSDLEAARRIGFLFAQAMQAKKPAPKKES